MSSDIDEDDLVAINLSAQSQAETGGVCIRPCRYSQSPGDEKHVFVCCLFRNPFFCVQGLPVVSQ